MATGNNGGDSNESTAGTQATPAGTGSGIMVSVAQQMQEAISSFAQENRAFEERFLALAQDPGGGSDGGAPADQAAPERINYGEMRDAAQQLQGSMSRFFQEDQRVHETLGRSMDRPSDELQGVKQEVKDNRREIDRLRDLIRNYRNW
jgi:hypothetical protein